MKKFPLRELAELCVIKDILTASCRYYRIQRVDISSCQCPLPSFSKPFTRLVCFSTRFLFFSPAQNTSLFSRGNLIWIFFCARTEDYFQVLFGICRISKFDRARNLGREWYEFFKFILCNGSMGTFWDFFDQVFFGVLYFARTGENDGCVSLVCLRRR